MSLGIFIAGLALASYDVVINDGKPFEALVITGVLIFVFKLVSKK